MIGALSRFLTKMDSRAWTSILVSASLLILLITLFFFGEGLLTFDGEQGLRVWLTRLDESPWKLPGIIAIYMVLALMGFPQFVLLGATVYAFGARDGAMFAWIATMFSASFTFGLGHFFGAPFVRRFAGDRVNKASAFIGRHGILASAIVRVVPSAPFIVVNMTAGMSHIPFWKFLMGTGLGIVPKIFVVAVIGASFFEFFLSRDPRDLLVIVAVVIGWLIMLYGVRRLYMRMRARDEEMQERREF